MITRSAVWMACLALLVAACVRDTGLDRPEPASAPAPVHAPRPGTTADVPTPDTWPALDREPELRVLIEQGPELSLHLVLPCQAPDRHRLDPGFVPVQPWGNGLSIGGRRYDAERVELEPRGDGPVFIHGSGRNAPRFAGRPLLVRTCTGVALVERIPMERYLAGVLLAEMGPSWPEAALGAQAIVARSYAAARFQARADAPWHLWRGTSDMAYDGARTPSPAVQQAVERTRGELLTWRGQAILARFHAASGGRTEASDHLWPGATLVDGTTPLGRYMPSVIDPAAEPGAANRKQSDTHHRWRLSIPRDEISERLQTWSSADRRRPRIGQVQRIAIASRHADSGRVDQVRITHRVGVTERTDDLDALDFRLAIGAAKVRSTWWDSCTMAGTRTISWVVEGRGYGHGVGLPQISAAWLAEQGEAPEAIVSRFYPGATLARLWR